MDLTELKVSTPSSLEDMLTTTHLSFLRALECFSELGDVENRAIDTVSRRRVGVGTDALDLRHSSF